MLCTHLNSLDLKSDAFVLVFSMENNIAVNVVHGFNVLRHHRSDFVPSLYGIVLFLNKQSKHPFRYKLSTTKGLLVPKLRTLCLAHTSKVHIRIH